MKNSKILKNLAGIICSFMFVFTCKAQAPQAFNYQAIVRNASGNPITDSNLTIRATIHSDSANGTILYQETQAVETNNFGLINLQIGNGVVVTGNFSTITWGTVTPWIQIEANFGSGYISMGATQLLSVPYALNALNGTTPYDTILSAGSGISLTRGAGDNITINNTSSDTAIVSGNGIIINRSGAENFCRFGSVTCIFIYNIKPINYIIGVVFS